MGIPPKCPAPEPRRESGYRSVWEMAQEFAAGCNTPGSDESTWNARERQSDDIRRATIEIGADDNDLIDRYIDVDLITMDRITVDDVTCHRTTGTLVPVPTVCANSMVGIRVDRARENGHSSDSFHLYHNHITPFNDARWLKYGDPTFRPIMQWSIDESPALA